MYLKQIAKNRKIKIGCAFTRKKINIKEKQTRGHMLILTDIRHLRGCCGSWKKKKEKRPHFFDQEKSMERFLEIKKNSIERCIEIYFFLTY
jgi:hypothetical protein